MRNLSRYIPTAFSIVLSMAIISYGQGNSFNKIRYNGGTIQTKVKPDDWDNKLTVTSDEIRLDLNDGQALKFCREYAGYAHA